MGKLIYLLKDLCARLQSYILVTVCHCQKSVYEFLICKCDVFFEAEFHGNWKYFRKDFKKLNDFCSQGMDKEVFKSRFTGYNGELICV